MNSVHDLLAMDDYDFKRMSVPRIDGKELARIFNFEHLTLNAWIQRGLIPGIRVGKQGKLRRFDMETAIDVAIVAMISSLGLSSRLGFFLAKERARGCRDRIRYRVDCIELFIDVESLANKISRHLSIEIAPPAAA